MWGNSSKQCKLIKLTGSKGRLLPENSCSWIKLTDKCGSCLQCRLGVIRWHTKFTIATISHFNHPKCLGGIDHYRLYMPVQELALLLGPSAWTCCCGFILCVLGLLNILRSELDYAPKKILKNLLKTLLSYKSTDSVTIFKAFWCTQNVISKNWLHEISSDCFQISYVKLWDNRLPQTAITVRVHAKNHLLHPKHWKRGSFKVKEAIINVENLSWVPTVCCKGNFLSCN